MRKVLSFTLAGLFAIGLVACGGDDNSGSSGDFCTMARAYEAANKNNDNPSSSEVEKALNDMKSNAPSEIKDDINKIADAYQAFKDAGSDPAKLQKLAAKEEELTKATDNVTKYLNDTCGIDTEN
jgi:hypothetical protein